jgi:hypothetical protein
LFDVCSSRCKDSTMKLSLTWQGDSELTHIQIMDLSNVLV